jgi:hypothetical protein
MAAPRWLRICVKCLRWIAFALFMITGYYVAFHHHNDGFDVFLRYILPVAIPMVGLTMLSNWLDNKR